MLNFFHLLFHQNFPFAEGRLLDNIFSLLSKMFFTVTETIVLFVAFLVYIIAGSLLMSYYEEGMTFGLAIYFNFVTLTTIGLGDLVPQSTDWLVSIIR